MKGNLSTHVMVILGAHPEVARVVEVPADPERHQAVTLLVTPTHGRQTAEEQHQFFMDLIKVMPITVRDAYTFEHENGLCWFAVIDLVSHRTDGNVAVIEQRMEIRLLPHDAILEGVQETDTYAIHEHELERLIQHKDTPPRTA